MFWDICLHLTMSEVEVKELGDDAPTDRGTSNEGANGSLRGTIVLLLLSMQSSTPAGHVGEASATPERPWNTGRQHYPRIHSTCVTCFSSSRKGTYNWQLISPANNAEFNMKHRITLEMDLDARHGAPQYLLYPVWVLKQGV